MPCCREVENQNGTIFLVFFKNFHSQFGKAKIKNLPVKWLVPVAESLDEKFVYECLQKNGFPLEKNLLTNQKKHQNIEFVEGDALECISQSQQCIASSGTITLECALLNKPTTVLYRLDDFTYELAKSAVKIPFVSLPNLIVGKELFPEHLQEIDASAVYYQIQKFADNPIPKSEFDKIRDILGAYQPEHILNELYQSIRR